MDFANIQAQLANLTSQLSQIAGRTTRQSVPTFGASYRQEYQANQRPQRGWENVNTWGYQSHNQSRNDLFSNTYISNWSDQSNSMWRESQQVQHEGYWQPYEEFYSRPTQPPQPHIQYAQTNSSSSMNNDQITQLLTTLVQGQQNQTRDMHNYAKEMQSQAQEVANNQKEMGEIKNQLGQIVEVIAQIQEQSELSNSNIANSMEDFEFAEAITLGSSMEVGDESKMSKPNQNMDEQLLIEEEEEETPTTREEQPLPQPPMSPKHPVASSLTKVGKTWIPSNVILTNVPFHGRFLQSKKEEHEKDIVEALPKVQSTIPILVTPKQVPDCVELFKELCTPRRRIQENEMAGEYQEFIKEDIYETTKPKEVEFDDTGQITTIVVNLAKFKVPGTLNEVVFVLEFMSEHTGKPPPRISISFSTNMLLNSMIQAPTLEFKPLAHHFKYHLPFKDQFHAVHPIRA